MATEGAHIFISSLFGFRSNVLLPMCCQVLYNMTCIPGDAEFPGLERIAKSLLTLPSTSKFDFVTIILKAMVNSVRFPSVRPFVMEDSILSTFQTSLLNVGNRENRDEIVYCIAACLRSLAASKQCRLDMISKGSVDLINQLMPYCAEKALLLSTKALHDLLSNVTSFPSAIFDVAVNTATDIMTFTDSFSEDGRRTAWQYVSSIIYTCTQQEMCRKRRLVDRICRCMPKLLSSTDSIIQFYAILSAGNIFFNNLCNLCSDPTERLKVLMGNFLNTGFIVTDEAAISGMQLALAMLSQEHMYVDILIKEGLALKVLRLSLQIALDAEKSFTSFGSTVESSSSRKLLKVMEFSAISMSRMMLRVDQELVDAQMRVDMSTFLLRLLSIPDEFVIGTALRAIQALSYHNLCVHELLSEELVGRTAELAEEYVETVEMSRTAIAILAVMSYWPSSHAFLSSAQIITILFKLVDMEDVVSRELIAACLCNMSISQEVRDVMIEKGIMFQLKKLSNVVNELIQLLCARCACNLTCSVDKHEELTTPLLTTEEKALVEQGKGKKGRGVGDTSDYGVISVIDMICQVRTSSSETKEVCARALLNMLREDTVPLCIAGGVQRAMASICTDVDSAACHAICGAALLIFTTTAEGRKDLATRNTAMQAMFKMVQAESIFTKLLIARAACNMLSQKHSSHQALMAGGFAVIKIISTIPKPAFAEMAARTLLSLLLDCSVHSFLAKEPISSVISVVIKSSEEEAFAAAIMAADCASQFDAFKLQLIEKGLLPALVVSVLQHKDQLNSEILSEAVARLLCNLTTLHSHLEWVVTEANILVILHGLWTLCPCSAKCGALIALCLRNLSNNIHICTVMIEQRAFLLVGQILEKYSSESQTLCRITVYIMQNFARLKTLHHTLMDQNVLEMLQLVVFLTPEGIESLTPSPSLTGSDVFNVIRVVDLIAESPDCRQDIVSKGAVHLFLGLSHSIDHSSRAAMAHSMASLSASPECRAFMVNQGAPTLLVALSKTEDVETASKCAEALAYLSETTITDLGMPSAMLVMTESSEVVHRAKTPERVMRHHPVFDKVKRAIRKNIDDVDKHKVNARKVSERGTSKFFAQLNHIPMHFFSVHTLSLCFVLNFSSYLY